LLRGHTPNEYAYSFNGKRDDEETGTQDYGMRIYNPSLGRFLTVDPLQKEYPELTPYQFASNRPIDGIDLDGLEFTKYWNKDNIINRTKGLIDNPLLINQRGAGTCVIAAVTYLLIRDQPKKFQAAVVNLYVYGSAKVNDYEIAPGKHLFEVDPTKKSNLTHNKTYENESVDWIFLSSVQDSQNMMWDFDGVKKDWADQGNSRAVQKDLMQRMLGYTEFNEHTVGGAPTNYINLVKTVNGNIDNGYNYILSIDTRLIDGYEGTDGGLHAVTLTSKINTTIVNDKTVYSFTIQTWGHEKGEKVTATQEEMDKYFSGYIGGK